MKGFLLLVLSHVLSFCAQSIAKPKAKPFLVSLAIKTMMTEYFVKNSPQVNIIHFGSKLSKRLVDEIMRKKYDFFTVKILEANFENDKIHKLGTSTVALFDSAITFNSTMENIEWMNPRSGVHNKHLAYIRNSTTNEITEIIRSKLNIDNVNFLLNESEESIDLVSPHKFSSK